MAEDNSQENKYNESQVRYFIAKAIQKGFNIRNQSVDLEQSAIASLTNQILYSSDIDTKQNDNTNQQFDHLDVKSFIKSDINDKDHDTLLVFGYIREFQMKYAISPIPNDIYCEILSIYPHLKKYVKISKADKIYTGIFQPDNKFMNHDHKNTLDLFKRGKLLMEQSNLQDAILWFEANIKQEILNHFELSEAWRYLGILQAENENENDAMSAFLQCYSCNPYNLEVLLSLSVSYCNESDTENALNCMKQWIANNPKYFGLITDDIHTFVDNDQHQLIVDLYLSALQIDAMDADLLFVLGVLYNLTSQYDFAADYFGNAIKMRPNDASLWNKLGATQANGGKYAEAINSYKRALEIKPNYVRTLSNLGISFANLDMHKQACQSYLKSLKLNPTANQIWTYLKMSLTHLDRSDLLDWCDRKNTNAFQPYFDF